VTTFAELMLAISLPFAGIGGDHIDCPAQYAPYRLNWTANIANERNLSGLPTMAIAMSPNGPALPVELKFSAPEQAFLFDSPRVSGTGTGELTLEQHLSRHSDYSTVELIFNRHVTNLHMTVEGLDENRDFSTPYRDTVTLGGWNKNLDQLIEPLVSQDGATQLQNEARQELRARLGRKERPEITPKVINPAYVEQQSTVEAQFPKPVSYVKLKFGSDAGLFEQAQFSQTPGVQSLRVTDVSFCVPFGSRVGD
jgi:hypothetical protein